MFMNVTSEFVSINSMGKAYYRNIKWLYIFIQSKSVFFDLRICMSNTHAVYAPVKVLKLYFFLVKDAQLIILFDLMNPFF